MTTRWMVPPNRTSVVSVVWARFETAPKVAPPIMAIVMSAPTTSTSAFHGLGPLWRVAGRGRGGFDGGDGGGVGGGSEKLGGSIVAVMSGVQVAKDREHT